MTNTTQTVNDIKVALILEATKHISLTEEEKIKGISLISGLQYLDSHANNVMLNEAMDAANIGANRLCTVTSGGGLYSVSAQIALETVWASISCFDGVFDKWVKNK